MKASIPPISSIAAFGETVSTSIDVHRLVSVFRRRLKVFVAVTALIFSAAVLITFQQVPQYTAVARVLIDQRKEQIVADQSVVSALPDELSAVDTETEVLRSRSIAESVAQQANLFADPQWTGAGARKDLLSSLVAWLSPNGNATVDPRIEHQKVVDRLLHGLNVARAGDTSLIDVSYTFPRPVGRGKIRQSVCQCLHYRPNSGQIPSHPASYRMVECAPRFNPKASR